MKRTLAGAATALLLAACAAHYVAPTAGPTASVTFAAEGIPAGAWVTVQNFADEACAESAEGNRLATFTTTAVQGQGAPHAGVARQMPADRPLVATFLFQQGAAGFTDYATCSVTSTFVPAAGGRYRMQYRVSPGQCAVTVIREDGPAPGPVASARKVEPACINSITG